VLALLLSSVLVSATQPPSADLKAKADAAQGSERIGPSLEYARQELEYANTLYTDGDVEKGEAAVNESLTYAKRAADASAAANKRLKQTEIDLRKLQHRMRDIGQSLNIDDRPPVEKAVQELEQLRADLLAKMFGEKAEPKEKSQ
jgi:exonuclease VII small subunit